MGLIPFKQKRELTCEEEESLAEERLESGLLSSDKGLQINRMYEILTDKSLIYNGGIG